jgi:NADH dehydrogenase
MGLLPFLLNSPAMLSLLGDVAWAETRHQAEYQWRLDAATLLAEATPVGAARFLGVNRKGNALDAILWILYAGVFELGCRIICVVISPALRHFLKSEGRNS